MRTTLDIDDAVFAAAKRRTVEAGLTLSELTTRSLREALRPQASALEVIDRLRQAPGCRWQLPGERQWEIVSRLCRKSNVSGKQVADAQHAALAIEHGCRWVT